MTANFPRGFDTQNDLSKFESKRKIELNISHFVRNET
jgi:hypothetical protein